MWKNLFEELGWINRYVAIWAFDWVYRGYVVGVYDQALILDDVHVVEETGSANEKTAKHETSVPGKILISLDAIENICIPNWANYEAKFDEAK